MRLGIVTPVLDDWESLAILLREIDRQLAAAGHHVHVFAVDDGSRLSMDPASLQLGDRGAIVAIHVIRLAANLGHQRAIAVGLIAASREADLDAVIVMDSDGEDRPEDILRLITEADAHSGQIVLAR